MDLVILPGLLGTAQSVEAFAALAPPGFRVRVIDYPHDELSRYEDLVPLVLERLPKTPFLLMGESFSGPVALRAAATRPPSLQGVVLCCSFVRSPTPWPFRQLPGLFSRHVVQSLVLIERLLAQRSHPRDLSSHAMQSPRLSLDEARKRADVIAARVRATLTVDVVSELRELHVPLLSLESRCDWVIPGRSRRLIRQVNPLATVAQVDGSHALLQSQPSGAWDAIHSWYGSLFQARAA